MGWTVNSECVGAERLTGCVNKSSLPSELMDIGQPRYRNDRSYLTKRWAIWDTCLFMRGTGCSRSDVFGSNARKTHVAHGATAWVTYKSRLVCALIVIDGCVCSCCSSPLCQLYTSGNEIQVLHVKADFVCVYVKGSLLSLTKVFLQRGRQHRVTPINAK